MLDADKNSLSVIGPGYALYLDDGITATGDGIVDHNGTFFATSSGQTVTLSYSGTVDPGYAPKYSVNGIAIAGNTFEMPDENVTVEAEVEKSPSW